MGNFNVFEIAVNALAANSQALSVTGQNIANVNTEGYSRQQAVFTSRDPQSNGTLELGRGVEISDIRAFVDKFAELRSVNTSIDFGENDARANQLQLIESAFNELGGEGLSTFLNDFFNSFHDLAADPTSSTARLNVLNSAQILVDRFNSLGQTLEEARTFINGDVSTTVTSINDLASQIAELNLKIQNAGEGGDMVFRDQRQLKVRELSELIDVVYVETTDDVFQIYVAGGMQLVNGVNHGVLGITGNDDNEGLSDITFAIGSGGHAENITSRISGGALAGLLEARDVDIPNYQSDLNELAFELATEVNTLHNAGYDLNGITNRDFFLDVSLANATAASLVTDLKNTSSTSLDANIGATVTIAAANVTVGGDLLTTLTDATGTHFDINVGDVITISGSVGATALAGQTLTVGAGTTMANLATAIQNALRSVADGDLTETAVLQADGSILVTSDGANAITNLQLTISGNTAFNTAFDYPANIAGGGATGDSAATNSQYSTTFSVGALTTYGNVASNIQALLRANGAGTETAAVQADGSILVTSGVGFNIAGLNLTITNESDFNTGFTFTSSIAAGGATGNNAQLRTGIGLTNTATALAIDPSMLGQPSRIAASDTLADVPGGNANALALANLGTSNVTFSSGATTFTSFYGNLLATIGSNTETATNQARFNEDVLRQAQISRERISGVNIEEEQMNLIRFQSAFEAAARLIQVADEILERLANLV